MASNIDYNKLIIGAHVGQKTENEFYSVDLGNGAEFRVLKRYQQVEKIAQGAQGVVCKAFDQVDQKYVAIKKLSKLFSSETPHEVAQAKRAFREICILKIANHKNVINLLNAFTPQESFDEFTDV